MFPGEICTAADLKSVLSTDANLTAYSCGRWAAVERKRVSARRQVRLERCPLERVRGRPTQSTVDEASHRCRFVGFNTLCAERARRAAERKRLLRGHDRAVRRRRAARGWIGTRGRPCWAGSVVVIRSPATASATTK